MDEATFERLLQKFKVVRSKDWVDPGSIAGRAAGLAPPRSSSAGRAGAARTTGAPKAALPAAPTAASAPSTLAELKYSDFWSGLDALLAAHVPDAAARKKVADAFQKIHYQLLGELNLEEANELGLMFAKEAAADLAACRASS